MSDAVQTRTIALAAGGTGGHLFPAESLARELKNRGYRVELISDDRVADFASTFPADAIHKITSGTVTGSGIFGKAKGLLGLARGILQCRKLVTRIAPKVMIGFGGYPTVPPVLAAILRKVPVILHEQNAVMGRANAFLSSKVNVIATGFEIGADKGYFHVGNPVRQAVLDAAAISMPSVNAQQPIKLLVFGGSQGARVMSDVLPPAIALLSPEHRKRLHITQQARDEDMKRVETAYTSAGVPYQCAAFFKDMPMRIAGSHLVIARSGASTVAELAVIGRASILVPLPGSLDQDQAANAAVLAKDGGAEIIMQTEFTPRALADRLAELIDHPEQLATMAAKARAVGISDAASRLADLVEKLAANENPVKPLTH